MLEKVNTRIPEPVTTPQASSFLDATSKGAMLMLSQKQKTRAMVDWLSWPALLITSCQWFLRLLSLYIHKERV
jgi:hypothetical protein